MKRKKRIVRALMVLAALIIMQLPVAEADASTSASDFKMEGSTLTKYRGKEKNVSIPDTVRVIGQGAFEDDTNVELVVIPNSVNCIEPYAFWGCTNLDTVVLGKGMTEVGDYAFTKCTGLEQISIPSTVTSIGIGAFADCANLKDITIPPETVDIHETAFDGCPRLTIHYEEGSTAETYAQSFYERQKQMDGYEEPSGQQPSDVVQPDVDSTPTPAETPVPTLPPLVEEGNVLGSTHIVGNRAVVMMNNVLLSVFGGGAGNSAVDGGSGAETGSGTSSEIEADSEDGNAGQLPPEQPGNSGNTLFPKYRIVDGRVVADQAYYRNKQLSEMALADGITEIGQLSFARSSLTAVDLPEGLEHIGYGAFYHCGQLSDVVLPDSIICIEPKAFEHTLWVDSFLAGEGTADAGDSDFLISGGVLVAYRGMAESVTVPEGVRVIAGEAFLGHGEIQTLSLPDSLVSVGEGAFEDCDQLAQVEFGSNVREIRDRAFCGTAMEEVRLPESVERLGLRAFGTTVIAYDGKEAERIYEASATRLANESYRVYSGTDSQEPGVTVEGLEGAVATLEGAGRAYTLTIAEPEDDRAMEDAFQRSVQTGIPEGMAIYELTLTDESGIPLTKLGSQQLMVTLPVPEALKGKTVRAVILDRNGQLEPLTSEQATAADGGEAVRIPLSNVAVIGIYDEGL